MSIKNILKSINKGSKETKQTPEEMFSSAVSLILVNQDIVNGLPLYIEARKKLDYVDFLLENNPVHILISGIVYQYCDDKEKAHQFFSQIVESLEQRTQNTEEYTFLKAYSHFILAKSFILSSNTQEKSRHLTEANALFTKLNDQKSLGDCVVLKASNFLNQQNYIAAIESFNKAIQAYMIDGHTDLITDCYLQIANANLELSNYKEWEWHLQLANDKIDFIENSGLKPRISLIKAKGLYKQNKIEDTVHCLTSSDRTVYSSANIETYIEHCIVLRDCYRIMQKPQETLQYEKTATELKLNLLQIEKENIAVKTQLITMFEKYELELLIQETSNIEINELKSKLALSKEENDRLVVLLSHDFKEPIRVINSFASLLEKNLDKTHSEKDKEYIQFILHSATRMSGHIDNLLKYIQLDTNTCEVTDLNLNEVIEEVRHELSVDIDDKKAIVVSSNLPHIKACKDVFNVLFYNLVENAIKFNHTLIIKIDYTKKNNQHEFSVTDNGIGIADDDKEKVFDLFRKLNKTNEFEGWGVGLSVSKKIVNSLGGQINIEDNPNGGTKVKFVLEDSYVLN